MLRDMFCERGIVCEMDPRSMSENLGKISKVLELGHLLKQ